MQVIDNQACNFEVHGEWEDSGARGWSEVRCVVHATHSSICPLFRTIRVGSKYGLTTNGDFVPMARLGWALSSWCDWPDKCCRLAPLRLRPLHGLLRDLRRERPGVRA